MVPEGSGARQPHSPTLAEVIQQAHLGIERAADTAPGLLVPAPHRPVGLMMLSGQAQDFLWEDLRVAGPATGRCVPALSQEGGDRCHRPRCLYLEQVGRADDVGVLAGREPGVEQLAALDEQGAAVAAEDRQHGAGDGRRLLRPEGPGRAGQLSLEEGRGVLDGLRDPARTVCSIVACQLRSPTRARKPCTAASASPAW